MTGRGDEPIQLTECQGSQALARYRAVEESSPVLAEAQFNTEQIEHIVR